MAADSPADDQCPRCHADQRTKAKPRQAKQAITPTETGPAA